jgi:hypothetical protein
MALYWGSTVLIKNIAGFLFYNTKASMAIFASKSGQKSHFLPFAFLDQLIK